MTPSSIRIAVLVPCFNEEAAVATVVADFRKALPSAEIFVYDNNSTDRTIAVARAAGAQVRSERRQGKGHVVRRMFADVDADIYVLVDGDATYDAASAPRMIDALLSGHLDMVVGLRGNALLCPPRGIGQQAQYLPRRLPDSRHHHEALPFGKAVAFFHENRSFSDPGFGRPRDPCSHHLSR